MSFVVGLTGSIATGKSTVLRFFAETGVPVLSADAVVHELYEGEAVAPVENLFPGVAEAGRINRQRLAERLVAEPARLKDLEALVHPLVRKTMLGFVEHARASGEALVVLEIPLLFETAAAYPLDAIAVTWCDPEIQRERALSRPGMSVEKLSAILARQLPQADKKARADFTIDTGTTLAETRAAVEAIVAECRRRGADAEKEPN